MSANPVAADTVWQRGRFDQRAGPGLILFGRMYEDATIEKAAFKPGGKILCIASAGCTAMALASSHQVVAIDINPTQLEYARRRSLGSPAIRGVAEQVMQAGRAFAPLAGWSSRRLDDFLNLEDAAEQKEFWNRYLNTTRFRFSFDRLMSVSVLRNVYASPFLRFLPNRFGSVLRGRMERCFFTHPNRSNPYAAALLRGDLPTPRSGSPVTEQLQFIQGDVADFLDQEPAGSYAGFSLSNVLDGASELFQSRLVAAIESAAAPEAVVVIRSFREPVAGIKKNLATADQSLLWGVVEAQPLSIPSYLLRKEL